MELKEKQTNDHKVTDAEMNNELNINTKTIKPRTKQIF